MKKTQLIEWGIITVGIIFGYKFLEGAFSFLFELLYSPDTTGSYAMKWLLVIILYVLVFFLTLRNSGKIALYLNPGTENDSIPFKIRKTSLIQVILIAICVTSIFSNIAEILVYIYEVFKQSINQKITLSRTVPNKLSFQLAVVESLVALIILCFSRDIAGWFIRKKETDELVLDSNPES
ncbi:MAG TPA: hypothetical protein VF487_06890 [Chitinophagaceae bacterium]